jgi:DNA polymerase-3 subunit alpha
MDTVFKANPGDNYIVFEVMEVEKGIKKTEIIPAKEMLLIENDAEIDIDNIDATTEIDEVDVAEEVAEAVEEIKVITKLEMPSRRLKVKISKELLADLEKLNVRFRLN